MNTWLALGLIALVVVVLIAGYALYVLYREDQSI